MAELWKLPVVFVIENNQYAMGTQREARSSAEVRSLQARRGLGIPGERSTAWMSRRSMRRARRRCDWCRAGKGPNILEMKTYRYRGHSMSDPAKYRTREEVQEMREKRDPIEHLRPEADRSAASPTEDDLKAIDKEIARRSSTTPPNSPPKAPSPRPERALHRRADA